MGPESHNSARTIRRAVAGVTLGTAFVTMAGAAGIAGYMVRRVTRRPWTHRPANFSFTPWELGIPFEEVEIPVGDSMLSGWFMPGLDISSPAILGLSGHGGTKADLLGISRALHAAGFSILVFDFRGAGQSPGSMRTLGHYETVDARAALDWLDQHVTGPIGALGYSLGGSIAIMLGGTDSRIQSVVADSPFASQYGVLAHNVRRRTGMPPGPIMKLAEPMLQVRHQHRYRDFAPESVIADLSPRPILIISPTADQLIPPSEAERLWDAAGEPKERWILEGLPHCGGYFHDRQAYCDRVCRFLRSSLAN